MAGMQNPADKAAGEGGPPPESISIEVVPIGLTAQCLSKLRFAMHSEMLSKFENLTSQRCILSEANLKF